MSVSSSKVISSEPLLPSDAKWVRLVKTNYVNPAGKSCTWESAERKSRPPGSAVDGVGIVAIIETASGPELLLQKQFRPPVGKVCIEVPAGLIDEGETPEQCAVRELKEETGYVGEVIDTEFGVTPLMFNDPGFCQTNTLLVHVTVDMTKAENQTLRPELEENEFIECFTIPLKGLYSACRRLEDDGYAIDARVGTLAEGIEIARRWNLTSPSGLTTAAAEV